MKHQNFIDQLSRSSGSVRLERAAQKILDEAAEADTASKKCNPPFPLQNEAAVGDGAESAGSESPAEEEEEKEEILGSDDDEQEDPKDYKKVRGKAA